MSYITVLCVQGIGFYAIPTFYILICRYLLVNISTSLLVDVLFPLPSHVNPFVLHQSIPVQCIFSRNSKTTIDVVYLGFKKAFDSVAPNQLMVKLWSFGITGKLA